MEENEDIFDPLAECLLYFAKSEGKTTSINALRAGLPLVNNQLTPNLLVQAAERINLKAKISHKPFEKIQGSLLPCILILKENKACVLQKIEGENAKVIFPQDRFQPTEISLKELSGLYAGYAIQIKALSQFDERATQFHSEKKRSWLWELLSEYKEDYTQLILAALLINLFALITPLYTMNVYDRVIPNNAFSSLWVLSVGVFIIYLFDWFIKMARTHVIESFSRRMDLKVASRLFSHMLSIRLAHKPASPGVFSTTIHEFEMLRDFFTSATLTAIVDMPFILLILAAIAMIGGLIVLIPLLAMPLLIGAGIFARISLKKQAEISMQGSAQKNALVLEALSACESIKSLGAEGQWQGRWEKFAQTTAEAGQSTRNIMATTTHFTSWLLQIVTVIVVITGVYMITANQLSMGGLIAVVILVPRALSPLAQIAYLLMRYHYAKASFDSLNQIFALPIDRPQQKSFIHRPKLTGAIKFERVTFTYRGESQPSTQEVSFQIKPGEKIALVGPLGAGKTTILKLILGFYAPQSGKIYFDGTDAEQIDPSDVRSNIAYAPQESALFHGTIRENVLLGRPLADDEAFLRALNNSGLQKIISRHPHGIDMRVSERGENLSVGQRQSVIMSRVFLSEAPIVLLDEPTSGMDNSSEAHLIEALQAFTRDKTVILSTHKPGMLALVDRMIVFEQGRIVGDGSKDEILAILRHNQGKRETQTQSQSEMSR